jgi:hypothetical protein
MKVYIVTFSRSEDSRPAKFIALANNLKDAIEVAWEHGGADFQASYDKGTGQPRR